MRPLKLHTKTTLLASAITVAVLIAALLTISARVVDLVRDDQKALAEWQAISLAESISNLPQPRDAQDVASAVSLVRGSRPNVVGVRVWERAGGVFVERVAAADSGPAEEIPEETKTALRSGPVEGAERAIVVPLHMERLRRLRDLGRDLEGTRREDQRGGADDVQSCHPIPHSAGASTGSLMLLGNGRGRSSLPSRGSRIRKKK